MRYSDSIVSVVTKVCEFVTAGMWVGSSLPTCVSVIRPTNGSLFI